MISDNMILIATTMEEITTQTAIITSRIMIIIEFIIISLPLRYKTKVKESSFFSFFYGFFLSSDAHLRLPHINRLLPSVCLLVGSFACLKILYKIWKLCELSEILLMRDLPFFYPFFLLFHLCA